ncbi:hypothetical protein DUNSADRAFT_480 [Dunaliella salina]|uniref:Encoded protein n=1 Tax=Dunaliella salina TaxID=3046 RepID=A0ABQ7FYU1_DUNSA|nr:hypothetical protein DUNSADRAFT_480 [Dunaliella salina]|eukprot:KAF5827533.1 hypothetical protein DUNSADRAFT_480 [Dunaliella salina]
MLRRQILQGRKPAASTKTFSARRSTALQASGRKNSSPAKYKKQDPADVVVEPFNINKCINLYVRFFQWTKSLFRWPSGKENRR